MNTDIQLDGLTRKQVALADIMWSINDVTKLQEFIATLPEQDHFDCLSIIELMRLAMLDQIVTDTSEARELLDDIFRK